VTAREKGKGTEIALQLPFYNGGKGSGELRNPRIDGKTGKTATALYRKVLSFLSPGTRRAERGRGALGHPGDEGAWHFRVRNVDATRQA